MIMTSEQIVRSWKQDDYVLSLSDEEQALMPDNPAGLAELSDEELLGAAGGTDLVSLLTFIGVSALVSAAYSVYKALK
jgi:mersacidin/lichenicidin family type 2 lantibiotic